VDFQNTRCKNKDTYSVIRNKSITNTNTNMLFKFVAVYAMKPCGGIRGKTPLILNQNLLWNTTRQFAT